MSHEGVNQEPIGCMLMHDPLSDDDIEGFLTDTLPDARRAEVEEVLLRDPETAAHLAHLRAHQEALRQIGREILNEPLPQRFLDILESPDPDDTP